MKALLLALAITTSFISQAWAQDTTSLLDIQHQWAHINYQMTDSDKQVDAFNALAKNVESMIKAAPNNPDNMIWLGIIQASTAGAKGGIGALSYAKSAKANLEKAIAINPNALSGSALTSLGALYHKVPGWPIGFGSDKKAKKLLKQGVKANLQGLDGNYFYADFLYDDGDYKAAKQYLESAEKAAPRPTRPVADTGRHKEIQDLMVKINKKL